MYVCCISVTNSLCCMPETNATCKPTILQKTNKKKSHELSQITETSEHQLMHGRFSKFVVGTYLLSNNSASLISFNSITKLVRNMLLSLFYK